MALSKKLKEQAKALKIPNYWNYGEKKLRELVKSKQPKSVAKKTVSAKPKVKTPAKPKIAVKPKSTAPAKPKKADNKKEILKHITACNKLIEDERKLIKGAKSTYHYSMLDRSLASLKDVTLYLGKIQ